MNSGLNAIQTQTKHFSQISGSDASRSITKQRKIASSFRDNHLYETFQLAHDLLRRALESWKSTKFIDETQQTLVNNLLRLALNCLSFDFIGTSPDESSDDLSCESLTVHPTHLSLGHTSHRRSNPDQLETSVSRLQHIAIVFRSLPLFTASTGADCESIPVFYPLIRDTLRIPCQALSCLVQFASVRRSLFNNSERAKFLMQLVSGVRYILENPQGLSDPQCYHEFCRLLARLKSNYQLSELVKVEGYSETIALITKFTVTSLQVSKAFRVCVNDQL